MLSVIILSVVMLSVVMLNFDMLNVAILSVVVPLEQIQQLPFHRLNPIKLF
jgi:hypothetical protein